MPDCSHWLNKLRNLNPNRSRTKGAAPHKPSLLLSLLDMAQDGELTSRDLRRTPGLHSRFNAFSSIALHRWGGKVDLAYPLYYLKSQDFWQPLDAEGRASRGVDATSSIRIDPDFLHCMQDAGFRRSARIVLVETYFPPEKLEAQLVAILGGSVTPAGKGRKKAPTPNVKRRKRFKLSAAGRAAIIKAQKARWAKARAAKKP